MKKYTKMILMLVIITVIFICGGCKPSEDPVKEPYNVCLIAVIANNNPVLDTAGIKELTQLPEAVGSTYSGIIADATPSIICEGTIPDFTGKGYSKDMIKRAQSSVAADITGRLNAACPDSDEVDIAAATSLAVRKIRTNEVDGRKNLLVYYGSGLSTAGPINMLTVPVSVLDVDVSAAYLAENMDLDLSGISIIWYCCGDVAGSEQDPLNEKERKVLKEFYKTWLTNMGAEDVTFMENTPLNDTYAFNCHVSAVKTEGTQSGLSARVVDFEEVEETEKEKILIETFADGGILTFDEQSVSFLPDSTEIANPEAAMESLSYVVSYMKTHPEFLLLICGTTTSAGEQTSCIAFSEQRAQAIRSLLLEKTGIDGSRIITIGCGWSSCLYVDDRDAAGNLDEHAVMNRSVKLLDYNSDAAMEIIQSLEV